MGILWLKWRQYECSSNSDAEGEKVREMHEAIERIVGTMNVCGYTTMLFNKKIASWPRLVSRGTSQSKSKNGFLKKKTITITWSSMLLEVCYKEKGRAMQLLHQRVTKKRCSWRNGRTCRNWKMVSFMLTKTDLIIRNRCLFKKKKEIMWKFNLLFQLGKMDVQYCAKVLYQPLFLYI